MPLENQTVIETRDGWMIRCRCSRCWHEFPKRPLSNGAQWSFDGNMVAPTFTPSMNESWNPPGPHHNSECESGRCHFIVTAGVIQYCGDCSHVLAGKSFPLEPWPVEKVRYYESLREHGWP